MEIRKTMIIRERTELDQLGQICVPVTRVAALGVVVNPFAGQSVEDLAPLFDIGGALGERLMVEALDALDAPAISYGKGSIVGVNGDFEHGGALIHPKLGKPMRAALGGGAALIASNVKMGGPGVTLDLPLGHKDEAWNFAHFDTMSVMVGDAPLPDELVLCLAIADGGRPWPRVGTGPITD